MTRRKLFRRLLIGAALPSYAFAVEPKWLDQTLHTVPMPGHDLGPVRILHLSDLHISNFVPFSLIERAVTMGLAAKPDLICVTGDFITNSQDFDGQQYRRILRRLSAYAPTFATLGNHDGGPWTEGIGGFPDSKVVRSLLADSGIRLLHNRNEIVQLRGQELRLAGVGDLWNDEVDPDAAFPEACAVSPRTARKRLPTVLLAHNPDTKDLLGEYPWDLMLCGHTHGGQVLVPGIGTRFVAVRDKDFISGLKRWNDRHIYISRGVGNLGGVRLNCRPEVTILQLTSAKLDDEHPV